MDTYFSTNKAILRLYNEWTKHSKLLIACDFDDTVFDFHNQNNDHKMVIELLKKCNELGFYVSLFTTSKPERYDFMRRYVEELGLKIDGINDKISYNILLDDRAGLGQAYTVLSSVIEMIEIAKEEESKIEK